MDLLIASNSVPIGEVDPVPTTGTPQYPSDGVPGTGGRPPTQFVAYHYKSMMMEILNVISAASLAFDRNDDTLLLQAIEHFIGVEAARAEAVEATLTGSTLTTGSNWYVKKWRDATSPSGYFIEVGGNVALPASGNTTSGITVTLPITFNVIYGGGVTATCYGSANSTYGYSPGAQGKAISTSQIAIQADTLTGLNPTPVVFDQAVPVYYSAKGY